MQESGVGMSRGERRRAAEEKPYFRRYIRGSQHGAKPGTWSWVPRGLHKQRGDGSEGIGLLASRDF